MDVSCTCKDGLVSFAKLLDVVVDPYTIEGIPLAEWTQRAIAASGLGVSVKTRKPHIGTGVYDELASLIRWRTLALTEFPNLTTNDSLLGWAERACARNLEYQFTQFADSVQTGTLGPLTMLARPAPRDEYEAIPDHFDDPYEAELVLLRRELYQDADAWERSRDEGWYYPD